MRSRYTYIHISMFISLPLYLYLCIYCLERHPRWLLLSFSEYFTMWISNTSNHQVVHLINIQKEKEKKRHLIHRSIESCSCCFQCGWHCYFSTGYGHVWCEALDCNQLTASREASQRVRPAQKTAEPKAQRTEPKDMIWVSGLSHTQSQLYA